MKRIIFLLFLSFTQLHVVCADINFILQPEDHVSKDMDEWSSGQDSAPWNPELKDTTTVKSWSFINGQVSGWVGCTGNDCSNSNLGLRYIPESRVSTMLGKDTGVDVELSVNAVTQSSGNWSSSSIGLYRGSVRYFMPRFEARTGLQKINFGPAKILRSLMWFDSIDPRDPLGITDGVTGLLMRYYNQNNSNVWFWGLSPGDNTKGLETVKTDKNKLEYGGRIQLPVIKGELGFTFDSRYLDKTDWLAKTGSVLSNGQENKIALDGNWDIGPGIYFESVADETQVNSFDDIYTGYLTLGTDYTLKNGPTLILEHFINTSGTQLDNMSGQIVLTAISGNYTVNIVDTINGILYYDWKNDKLYEFAGYQKMFDNWKFNLLLYSSAVNTSSSFSGNGIRFIVTYNH